MKPQSIGRVLGTGLRVAGRIASQQMAGTAGASSTTPDPQGSTARPPQSQPPGRPAAQIALETSRGVARGLGGFLRPFGRVGGTIWLEVTGVFFALPVLVFTPTAWRARQSWIHGPDHRTFLVSAVIIALFLYLSVSSFMRARRR